MRGGKPQRRRPAPTLAATLFGLATIACGDPGLEDDAAPRFPAMPAASGSLTESSVTGVSPEDVVLAIPWTTGRMNRETTPGQAPRTVDSVAFVAGAEFDRFVITLPEDGEPFPGYTLEVTDQPAVDCAADPEESSFDDTGEAHLFVRLQRVRGHDDAGRSTSGPRSMRPSSEHVTAMHRTCDFEGVVEWVFDLPLPYPYRILELRAPPRLVIDIQHPYTQIEDSPGAR